MENNEPDVATAEFMGRKAFAKGLKAIPALDPDFREWSLRKGCTVNRFIAEADAWAMGWHRENLKPED